MKSEARSAHKELESCKSSKKDEIDDWDKIMRKVAEEAERMRLEERETRERELLEDYGDDDEDWDEDEEWDEDED